MRDRVLIVLFATAGLVCPQSTGSIEGVVADPFGAPVAGARVRVANDRAGFERELLTGGDGRFAVSNLPLQTYLVDTGAPGFALSRQSIAVNSNVPVRIAVGLRLAGARESVTVTAAAPAVDPDETGTRAQMNQSEIERIGLRNGARGLESVLIRFPGFAQNANGAIHPRGAHNQMTFVVDGMAISDQLTGAFANAVDPNIVQTVELFTGNVPAEYGNKTAAVANVTTKSGLGSGRPFAGSVALSGAEFDTLGAVAQVAGEHGRIGYTTSVNTSKSNRYLDQVSLENLHNGGNSERAFARVDYQASGTDTLRLNTMAGRSSFQLANLRSQHVAAQDQRQLLRDASASLGWVRVLSPRSTLDATLSYRTSIAQLFPSAGDTPVTAAQARHLGTVTASFRANSVRSAHTLRAGIDVQHFPVSENFSFGDRPPQFRFHFSERSAGKLYSGFAQDNIRWRRLSASLGLRYDDYRFLSRAVQMQPRAGIAFHIRETGTVLRASYNRMFQTPPNENLLLSNSTAAARLTGRTVAPIRPERQNLYEAGVQQAIGRKAAVNASYYHKDSSDQQDNDNFFNTGIIFPITLRSLRVNGIDARVSMLPVRGVSGSLGLSHARAISTPPFTGGIFLGSTALDALSAGPFVIDHDQKLSLQANLEYTHSRGFWLALAARYDSGLVANPSNPAQVAADPDYADLLPYVDLLSSTPRVRPRTIADFTAGYEHTRDGHRRWEISAQVANLTNVTALYNFQSIFVGTRLVQPRSAGVKMRWYW